MKAKSTSPSPQAAAFLDRDGVICEFVEELSDISEFRFREGIAPAIRKLNQAGYLVFVATNQPNIARGKMTWNALEQIHQVMVQQLSLQGARIDKVYFCPHRVGGVISQYAFDCDCRKPKPGLLEQAARDYSIDRAKSMMIGDTWRDIECAKRFGITGLAVKGGSGFPYAPHKEESRYQPSQLFSGPLEAVNWWLENQ